MNLCIRQVLVGLECYILLHSAIHKYQLFNF
uniref:Uncharacterized protein n=1 Tax=Arundo donax TaxID=35708 RepID=A0A0A8XNT1_ARUDO